MNKIDFKNMDKKKKTLFIILIVVFLIVITLGIAIPTAIIKSNNYNLANEYYSNAQYGDAMVLFKKLVNYKDSKKMYVRAYSMHTGDYKEMVIQDEITEFVIPDGTTDIIDNAFSGCKTLTSVEIPNSVEKVGLYAFENCTNLEKVNYLGDENSWLQFEFDIHSSNPTSNGADLYIDGEILTFIKINDLSKIGDYAFYGAKSLKSVEISENVKKIGLYAFTGCANLEKVNFLGDENAWSEIEFASYYSNPTTYAKDLYIKGELLTEANLTTAKRISAHAFERCQSLTNVTIGDEVLSIGVSAFDGCKGLENIKIGESVSIIGESSFYDCVSLKDVIIPNSVTSIGFKAFSNCTSLKRISLPFIGEKSDGSGKVFFGYIFGQNNPAYGHDSVPTSLETVIITGSSTIYENAFYECKKIKKVYLTSMVTSIEDSVFYKCNSLTIYCEVEEKPSGWSDFWNSGNNLVCWGYSLEEI